MIFRSKQLIITKIINLSLILKIIEKSTSNKQKYNFICTRKLKGINKLKIDEYKLIIYKSIN